MRLFTSEKEAQVLQLALAHLVTENDQEREIAQTLLSRIAQCLDLQGYERRAVTNG